MLPPFDTTHAIENTVREEWGRILAALTKSLGNIQLAEDSLQDAVVEAMRNWPDKGLPRSPAAWLITTARRRAIDRLRRTQNFASKAEEIAYLTELEAQDAHAPDQIPDKRLEMIFTCCHPALEEKTQVALTLRTLGGLTTEQIALAFIDKPDAMAQRLVRAKKKITAAGIPYRIPERDQLQERLNAVLRVIYLIFNEGYAAHSGDQLTRTDLSNEAIRLAHIIESLLPEETEVQGLLALMLLHDSRRYARLSQEGQMVALEDQNRARWDRSKITAGSAILEATLPKQRVGPYQLQAAISALHAQSPSWAETDWHQIVGLYALLYRQQPNPVIRINQAIALSYAHTLETGMDMLHSANADGKLERYQPYHAARADLFARAGRSREARAAFEQAIALSDNSLEREFLSAKAAALS